MVVESSNFERRATQDPPPDSPERGLSVELHKIPHLIVRSVEAMGVCGFLVAELGAIHFHPQVVMNFGQCFRCRTHLLIFCLVG